MGRKDMHNEHYRKVITCRQALSLAGVGVTFYSGCTEPRWQQLERLEATVIQRQGAIIDVNLQTSGITDDELVHPEELNSLGTLHLDATSVTDAGLVHLAGLTSLYHLSLNDTPITNAGVAKLKEALPNCKTIR